MNNESLTIDSRHLRYVATPHFPGQFNAAAFLKILEETKLIEKMNEFFLGARHPLTDLMKRKRLSRCR